MYMHVQSILSVSHIQFFLPCEYMYSASVKSIHFSLIHLEGKVLP